MTSTNRTRAALFGVAVVLALAACRSEKPRALVTSSAPDHQACAVDSDCTFWLELDSTACCFASGTASAQSVAYMRWATQRESSADCASVKCKPLPPPAPAPPGVCWNTPRCTLGKCTDACNDR